MKKYVITGAIGLLAVGAVAWFMISGRVSLVSPQLKTSDNVFVYLPDNFDQLLYFSFDDALRSAMDKMQNSTDNEWFKVLANQVDEVVVIQSMTGASAMSLMYLVSDTPIDINVLQQQWVIVSDPSYRIEQLATNVWIYGEMNVVKDYMTSYEENEMLSMPGFADWAERMYVWDYNIGMFSFAKTTWPISPITAQFAQWLRWTAVTSYLGGDKAYGEVVMQFTSDIVPPIQNPFIAQFADTSDSDALAFAELTNLIHLFGVGEEQFTLLASLFLKQMWGGVYSALLSSEDYSSLYAGLNSNVALELTPSSGNIMWLGLTVSFWNQEMFEVLSKLWPLWKTLIAGASWADLVEEFSSQNIVRYSSPEMVYTVVGQSIQVSRDDRWTYLQIWFDWREESNSADWVMTWLLTTPETILSFVVDAKKLQSTFGGMKGEILWNDLASASYLQGWVVKWELSAHADDDQLVLSFHVE